jgi:hypothetical protein
VEHNEFRAENYIQLLKNKNDRFMKRLMQHFWLAAILTLPALYSASAGVPFAAGDIFVGGNSAHAGQVNVYDHSGTFLETITTGSGSEQLGMAFDSSGDLYANGAFPASGTTYKISHTDSSVSAFVNNDPSAHNESIVFNQGGHMFIGQPDGTHQIIERDASGAFVNRYTVTIENRGSDWIDLAADQKTLYYTSEGKNVMKYDVSTGTQLANFATGLPGSDAYALRILPDGTVLVADTDRVVRLNSSGSVIQTYGLLSDSLLFALNLDPNGTDFWTAGYFSGQLYEYNIASGALDASFNTGGGISGLAVAGELTVGGPPQTVPDGGATVALLGMGLAGLMALRRKLA